MHQAGCGGDPAGTGGRQNTPVLLFRLTWTAPASRICDEQQAYQPTAPAHVRVVIDTGGRLPVSSVMHSRSEPGAMHHAIAHARCCSEDFLWENERVIDEVLDGQVG